MYLRTGDGGNGPRMTSGFALRVTLLGALAVVLFAVIFFRLWYLQVLSGDKYLAQANDNRTATTRITAPRGEIVDRHGKVLVGNRTALALQVNPLKLPAAPGERRDELTRVGQLVNMSLKRVRVTMHKALKDIPGSPVTLRRDVSHDVVFYIEENRDQFPGIDINQVFVRRYPDGDLAAHLVGYVREVTPEQLKQPEFRGVEPGDEVGQDGLELEYDHFLRGTPGEQKITVNSLGTPQGQLSTVEPRPGDTLKLSLDEKLQQTGESALAAQGLPGAFVTMNVDNGQILGMGSYPTYDPSLFARPVLSSKVYDALSSENSGDALLDRAIDGLYPTGSAYKPLTSVAALSSGVVTPTESIYDSGTFNVGGVVRHNAGGGAYGSISMQYALQVSSDVFYYILGDRLFHHHPFTELQKWSHQFGIGRPTGIDLPGESAGLLPTPAWRNQLYAKKLTDRLWSEGDNVSLAVGQGDLQADPLQLAVAYSAIANGGTIVTPHLGMEVDDSTGRVVDELDPGPQRHLKIDPAYRQVILAGLHDAAQSQGGTSYPVFGSFPVPVAGKTGTAERPPHPDQAWYAVMAPYPNPKIVTIVTFEGGGFGATTAAPAALQILSQYFHKTASPVSSAGGYE